MGRRTKKNPEVTLGRRQRRRKEQRRKNVREIISTILYLAILCAAVYFILHYVGQRTVVRGDSMDTTLSDGQNLIMDKLSYHFRDPERYDIVIFPGPEEYGEHPYYIKRVIGLPGETVQIKKGKVYINGKRLKSDIYGITKYIGRNAGKRPGGQSGYGNGMVKAHGAARDSGRISGQPLRGYATAGCAGSGLRLPGGFAAAG